MAFGSSGFVRTLSPGAVMNDMDNNNQHPLAGLYSGEILRYVVQALDIKDDVLDSRTARRFFAGEPKNEYNRSQIFEALGQALIQRDIAPESLDALPDGVSAAMAIGMAVNGGGKVDHLMATIQSRGTTVVDVGAVAERFLRLVAVDLAIRLFALNRLTGFPLPDPEPPLWAQENGGGHVLRRYLCQSGLTRRTLAARLGRLTPPSTTGWMGRTGQAMPTSPPSLRNWRQLGLDRTQSSLNGNCAGSWPSPGWRTCWPPAPVGTRSPRR